MKTNTSKDFNIYVMSYRRPNAILSQKLFEYCTYVVREEEAELYKQSGVENILAIPDGEVHDFMSTLYWIIENTPEDVIFVADDDIQKYVYRMDDTRYLELEEGVPDKEKITSEVERIAQLIVDLGIGMAFDQPNLAPYNYDKEFQFKGMPGHTRWINKSKLKAKYDASDPATSDVDMMMQELLSNRIIMQPKYLCVKAFMDTNEGIVENRQEHIDMVESMKNKWGKYYEYNYKKNTARIVVDR